MATYKCPTNVVVMVISTNAAITSQKITTIWGEINENGGLE